MGIPFLEKLNLMDLDKVGKIFLVNIIEESGI